MENPFDDKPDEQSKPLEPLSDLISAFVNSLVNKGALPSINIDHIGVSIGGFTIDIKQKPQPPTEPTPQPKP
jgi:hypothetical protein